MNGKIKVIVAVAALAAALANVGCASLDAQAGLEGNGHSEGLQDITKQMHEDSQGA